MTENDCLIFCFHNDVEMEQADRNFNRMHLSVEVYEISRYEAMSAKFSLCVVTYLQNTIVCL